MFSNTVFVRKLLTKGAWRGGEQNYMLISSDSDHSLWKLDMITRQMAFFAKSKEPFTFIFFDDIYAEKIKRQVIMTKNKDPNIVRKLIPNNCTLYLVKFQVWKLNGSVNKTELMKNVFYIE